MKLIKQDCHIEGDKRQYFPYVLEWTCKDCGTPQEHNFRSDYISYPTFGEAFEFSLYCKAGCETETTTVVLKPEITLTIIES